MVWIVLIVFFLLYVFPHAVECNYEGKGLKCVVERVWEGKKY